MPDAGGPYVAEALHLVGGHHVHEPARSYLGKALRRLGGVEAHVCSVRTDLVLTATPTAVVAVTHSRLRRIRRAGPPMWWCPRQTWPPGSRSRPWPAATSAHRAGAGHCQP